jgi:hypothetical protein
MLAPKTTATKSFFMLSSVRLPIRNHPALKDT